MAGRCLQGPGPVFLVGHPAPAALHHSLPSSTSRGLNLRVPGRPCALSPPSAPLVLHRASLSRDIPTLDPRTTGPAAARRSCLGHRLLQLKLAVPSVLRRGYALLISRGESERERESVRGCARARRDPDRALRGGRAGRFTAERKRNGRARARPTTRSAARNLSASPPRREKERGREESFFHTRLLAQLRPENCEHHAHLHRRTPPRCVASLARRSPASFFPGLSFFLFSCASFASVQARQARTRSVCLLTKDLFASGRLPFVVAPGFLVDERAGTEKRDVSEWEMREVTAPGNARYNPTDRRYSRWWD